MKTQQIGYSIVDCYLMYAAGLFVGVVTPGRLGDFVKVLYLRRDRHPTGKSFMCALLDRILDLVFLAICTYFSLLWMVLFLRKTNHLLLLFFVMSPLCGVYLCYRVRHRAMRVFEKVFNRFTSLKLQGTKTDLADFYKNLKLSGLNNLADISLITILGWLMYFIVIYLLIVSIQINLSFWTTVAFFCISTMVTFIPISVAGIGTRDVTLIGLFSMVGLSSESAVAFSGCILLIYLLTAAFGIFAWMRKPIPIRRAPIMVDERDN